MYASLEPTNGLECMLAVSVWKLTSASGWHHTTNMHAMAIIDTAKWSVDRVNYGKL